MQHYLYRHIRLDTNEPFYIGIGSKTKTDIRNNYYSRAYNKSRRSTFWKNIVNKTDYCVEIVLKSDNYGFIKSKEIEFIKLYGRKDKNNGSLVNLTDGGDGNLGWKVTEEFRNKISKIVSDSYQNGTRRKDSLLVYQYDLNGEFVKIHDSLTSAAISVKGNRSQIAKYIQKSLPAYGYQWFYKHKGETVSAIRDIKRRFRGKIEMINPANDKIEKIFDNMKDVMIYLDKNINGSSYLNKACMEGIVAYNYKWKHHEAS